MTYSIVYERIKDGSLPPAYFYAHIPTLDLTTHGKGIQGAKKAAIDLIQLWIAEKKEKMTSSIERRVEISLPFIILKTA